MTARLVLASGSPRRRELLGRFGVGFDVRPPDVDETPHDGEEPAAYVLRIARTKAAAVARDADEIVVAADTTVTIDGSVLGKPVDADEARSMLTRLAGRWHQVHTGLVVRYGAADHDATVTDVVTTAVEMVPPDEALIDWYVATGEPVDRAGAYALQGIGELLVAKVDGSVSNVVGLPLVALRHLLESGPSWSLAH